MAQRSGHEDYGWDARTQALRIGDSLVTEDVLDHLTGRIYEFMSSAETAWALAREYLPAMGEVLDADPGEEKRAILNRSSAMALFGANGLALRQWTWDDDVLDVELDSLRLDQVNPCVQALLWTARLLPSVATFVVHVPSEPEPILTVDRKALDLSFPLWWNARRWFEVMPLAVFIPATTSARLRSATAEQAVAAAIWFAMESALISYDELYDADPSDIKAALLRLSHNLVLAAEALSVTADLLPGHDEDLLGRPYKLARAAAIWAKSGADGDTVGPLLKLRERIGESRDATPTPEALPGLEEL